MLNRVELFNFRSYEKHSRDFDSGVNLVRGPNGSGKTNLLEAIYFAATGQSFRAIGEADMVRSREDWARVDAVFGRQSYSRRIELLETNSTTARAKKTLLIDDSRIGRPAARRQPVVIFEPNQLKAFYSGPSYRRDLMDELADLDHPDHGRDLRRYRRSLAQRNSAIKTKLKKRDFEYDDQLFVWDLRLSQLAEAIHGRRAAAVKKINQRASDIYSGFAGKGSSLDFTYATELSADSYGSSMLARLQSSVEQDIARQRTSVGVHRDDMVCVLNGFDLLSSASRGEKRTVLLAIKLIAASPGIGQDSKLLLLDDLFSELDATRQAQLEKVLPELTPQTIATTV